MKGGNFEREVSKQLSLWWSTGLGKKPDDGIFWRSTTSGARATVRSRQKKRTKGNHGDLTAIDPIGKPLIDAFTLELKRGYNKFTIADLLDKPPKSAKQKYEEWFEQADQAHRDSGSFSWALIVKRDRRETLIFIPSHVMEDTPLNWFAVPTLTICAVVNGREISVLGCQFEDFLKGVNPKQIIQISKM